MKPQIIVSHTDDTQLFVWNTEKQPNRAGEGPKVSRPQLSRAGPGMVQTSAHRVTASDTWVHILLGARSTWTMQMQMLMMRLLGSLRAHAPTYPMRLSIQAVVSGLDPCRLRPAPLLQKDAGESVPDLVLTGHKDIAAFALATTSAAPLVASGGSDNLVRAAGRGATCCTACARKME